MKLILSLFALLLLVVTAANPASASRYYEEHLNLGFLAQKVFAATGTCTPIYGGNQNNCDNSVVMDKTILNPQSNQYVENMGINDPKYSAGQTVTFRLTVKNTSGNTVKDIKVKDILPDFVDYVSGTGSYDKGKKTLNYTVAELKKDETRTVEVKVKVFPEDRLPNQNISCVVNQAVVTVGNKTTQDNTQFCIQKQSVTAQGQTGFPSTTTTPGTTKGGVTQPTPTPVKTAQGAATTKGGQPLYPQPQATNSPSTGPELLGLFGLIPAAVGGAFLRRKTA